MQQATSEAGGAALVVMTLLATAFLVLGCDSGTDPTGGGHAHPGQPSGATCPPTQTLTYQNFGQEFFAKYCLSCHSTQLTGSARNYAPVHHNFDTLELIRQQIEDIDRGTAAGPNSSNHIMPNLPPFPTHAERVQLGEWLACGAP